jgi:SpoVK/Ycf46/Vps4 family AAA+-type ATPase
LSSKEGAPEPACAAKDVDVQDQSDEKYIFGKSDETKRLRLTRELQLICAPRVRGYSLKKKEWLLFYLDAIKDIEFDDKAFDSLVLPEDQKELILSFAESQAMGCGAFDDVISGKGRGHITLLSGPPGVGKTLTAESVAEHMHAPLYMMSAGDLGIHPDEVESRLTNILEMIAKWNAVLLLDECDVFLEARDKSNLERNKLVSIFLRVLEYYEGILFLTTNRIDNIDTAFQSRIHVSLSYPDLNNDSRRHIWENFLRGLDAEWEKEWSGNDLDELSKVQLNGRQIKNVLKSAALLSARKKEKVGRKWVDKVLAIEKRRPEVARGLQ